VFHKETHVGDVGHFPDIEHL